MIQQDAKEITTNRQSDILQRAGETLLAAVDLLAQAGMSGAARLVNGQAGMILEEARKLMWQDALADADHRLNRGKNGLPCPPENAQGGVGVSAPASHTGEASYIQLEKKIGTASGGMNKNPGRGPKLEIIN